MLDIENRLSGYQIIGSGRKGEDVSLGVLVGHVFALCILILFIGYTIVF